MRFAVCWYQIQYDKLISYSICSTKKCCWMTSIIWLWCSGWLGASVVILFCLCIQLLLCYSIAPYPTPHPHLRACGASTRPHGCRHCDASPLPCCGGGPPLPMKFRCTAVCPQSLRNWSHWKIRTAEKLLNWLTAAVNQQTCWNVTA